MKMIIKFINNCFSMICVVMMTVNPLSSVASTIHVCYLMDTKNKELVSAVQKMNESIENQAAQMQQALSATLKRYYATGDQYNSEKLYLMVENMAIDPLNDIIILAVMGHGANDGQSRYPIIRFSETDKRSFSEIMDLFLVKKPAYLISFVNACNAPENNNNTLTTSISPQTAVQNPSLSATPVLFTVSDLEIKTFSDEKYQKLFEKINLTLAVSYLSAQAGSTTLVDATGGESFSALMESLRYWTSNVQTETPSWEKILLTAQLKTIQRTQTSELECPYLEMVRVRVQNNQIERSGEGLELCK